MNGDIFSSLVFATVAHNALISLAVIRVVCVPFPSWSCTRLHVALVERTLNIILSRSPAPPAPCSLSAYSLTEPPRQNGRVAECVHAQGDEGRAGQKHSHQQADADRGVRRWIHRKRSDGVPFLSPRRAVGRAALSLLSVRVPLGNKRTAYCSTSRGFACCLTVPHTHTIPTIASLAPYSLDPLVVV